MVKRKRGASEDLLGWERIEVKAVQNGRDELQFCDGFGNLVQSEGLATLISGIYGKSTVIIWPRQN